MPAQSEVFQHGTAGGYTNHKCRCIACSEAHRAACAAGAKKRKLAGPKIGQHGTSNGYTNYGCRCDECREAYVSGRRRAGRITADRAVL